MKNLVYVEIVNFSVFLSWKGGFHDAFLISVGFSHSENKLKLLDAIRTWRRESTPSLPTELQRNFTFKQHFQQFLSYDTISERGDAFRKFTQSVWGRLEFCYLRVTTDETFTIY